MRWIVVVSTLLLVSACVTEREAVDEVAHGAESGEHTTTPQPGLTPAETPGEQSDPTPTATVEPTAIPEQEVEPDPTPEPSPTAEPTPVTEPEADLACPERNDESWAYIANAGNASVEVYNLEGRFICSWGALGYGAGQFINPKGISTTPDGDVFVADTGNNRIQRFTARGEFVDEWHTGDNNSDLVFVAVSPSGNLIYAVDRARAVVEVMDPDSWELIATIQHHRFNEISALNPWEGDTVALSLGGNVFRISPESATDVDHHVIVSGDALTEETVRFGDDKALVLGRSRENSDSMLFVFNGPTTVVPLVDDSGNPVGFSADTEIRFALDGGERLVVVFQGTNTVHVYQFDGVSTATLTHRWQGDEDADRQLDEPSGIALSP